MTEQKTPDQVTVLVVDDEPAVRALLGGIDADDGRFPDFVLRRNWQGDWGQLSVAALGWELRVGRDGADDATFGGAIGIAGLQARQGRWRVPEDEDQELYRVRQGNATAVVGIGANEWRRRGGRSRSPTRRAA